MNHIEIQISLCPIPLRSVVLVVLGLFIVGILKSQTCDKQTIMNTLTYSNEIIQNELFDEDELIRIESEIERMLEGCRDSNITGRDTLEYYILLQLYKISESRADIEKMVTLLTRLSRRNITIEEFNPTIMLHGISQIYAPLRISYPGEDMTSMAVIKSVQGGDTRDVIMELLPPVDAWAGDIDQKRNLKRIELITQRSRAGNFPLYFDSYDETDGYFYFEVPYVPLLPESQNSAMWYAITFDGKKRYRTNFSDNMTEQERIIELEPLENWILVKQIPEKYVLLTLHRDTRVRVLNKAEQRYLKSNEFFVIDQGKEKEYYLPSNQNYSIEITTPGNQLFRNIERVAWLTSLILLAYTLITIAG